MNIIPAPDVKQIPKCNKQPIAAPRYLYRVHKRMGIRPSITMVVFAIMGEISSINSLPFKSTKCSNNELLDIKFLISNPLWKSLFNL